MFKFSTEWTQPWVGALLDRLARWRKFRAPVSRARYDNEIAYLRQALVVSNDMTARFSRAVDELEQDLLNLRNVGIRPVYAEIDHQMTHSEASRRTTMSIRIAPFHDYHILERINYPDGLSDLTKHVIKKKTVQMWSEQASSLCDELFERIRREANIEHYSQIESNIESLLDRSSWEIRPARHVGWPSMAQLRGLELVSLDNV